MRGKLFYKFAIHLTHPWNQQNVNKQSSHPSGNKG